MEIILLERVEKLGQMGDVVSVKPGYARNFLLPQGKALRANKGNLDKFETEKSQREADNLARRSDAETESGKMDGLAVSMVRAASEMGQLFGSVTARDIADAVTDAGFTINRTQVIMEKSIKTLGLHDTRVRLHPEVTVTVRVNVARSLDVRDTICGTSPLCGRADGLPRCLGGFRRCRLTPCAVASHAHQGLPTCV